MDGLIAQLGKLSIGLAILVVVLLIVKALPALVNSFQRKTETKSTNGDAGKKDVSFWIREYEKAVAPVLEELRQASKKLDELLRRKR